MSHVSRMSKVLWGEGLFLRPQHFQRQDAYHEARIQDLSTVLHPYGWGCRRIKFDPQALAGGTLRPLDLSVVFADSEPYDAPVHDALPDAISLKELSSSIQATTIHLALPLIRDDGDNCAVADLAQTARYRQTNHATKDLYTDSTEAELAYLGKLTRLLTDDQPRDAYTSVPIARIRRTSTGGFELDEDFIPPCVCLQASPILVRHLRSMLDSLQAKVDALYGVHRQTSQNIIEFRSGDIASFWLLHTINSSFGALTHLLQHQRLHPERLHQELLRMAGALMTFSNNYRLGDLPHYRHELPQQPFERLFEIARDLLDTVISTRYFQISLTEIKPSFHLGRLDSQRIDEGATFYLSVASALPAQEIVQSVPVRFKVGAPDDVEKCVLSALPGVRISHAAQVPAAIPVRPGNQYFQLDPRGPLYERMLKAQSIMIYVPAGVHDLKMELIAVAS